MKSISVSAVRTGLLALAALVGAAPVSAATFVVASTADSGAGTLREAVASAIAAPGGPHVVTFNLAPDSVIVLDSGLPMISGNLTIDASASPGLVVDAKHGSRQLSLATNSQLTLRGFELRDGAALNAPGGCVWSDSSSSSLTIQDMVFAGCRVRATGPARGGAINIRGSLFVYDSRFEGNVAGSLTDVATGGAIYALGVVWMEDSVFEANTVSSLAATTSGGAITAGTGTMTVLRSRFIGNVAEREDQPLQTYGGAVYVRNDSTTTVRQSLFFDNTAGNGAALNASTLSVNQRMDVVASNNTFVGNHAGPAVLFWNTRTELRNNTFWKNTTQSPGGAHLLVHGGDTAFTAVTHNLFAPTAGGAPACHHYGLPAGVEGTGANVFSDTSCAFIGQDSYLETGDLRIRGLRATGSALHDIPVVDLFADSIVIDGGNIDGAGSGAPHACAAGDARDEGRPADGDGDGLAACDIGALELQREASLFADDFQPVLLR